MSSAPPASQSKPTNHRRHHHNAAAPRHHHSHQQQQQQQQPPQPRYVPKSTAPSAPKPSPPPSLTTALRSSAPPSASGAGAGGAGGPADGFVAYLPHDEAVAAGLGGVDAQESQAVVDLLNDALAALLRAKPREFWRQVAQNTSLHEFLDSYLQFRHRWYDLPHRGPKGTVDGLVVGELELCRRVFMVLYRISSNKDPGAGRGESLSMKEHADLLQEKKLLDLPKLLDICAIYGHDNGKLTSSLVTNAINVQPSIPDGINTVIPQFLGIFFTMQERCMNSLQVLTSSGPTDNGYAQLQKDFSEVLDFVNDAIVTLDAFVEAHQPSALLFCASFETNYGVEELPNTLSRLYDSLLPSLHQGCQVMSRFQNNEETASETILSDIVLGIKMLSSRIVKFGWRLLEFCYLNDQLEDLDAQASSKMFPAKVEDPMIRGDILIQTLKDINREATYSQENPRKTFLQALEKDFQLMSRIRDIRNKGWIHIDEEQFKFISCLCGSTLTSWNTVPDLPVSSYDGELHQKNEDAAITESKISQVRDLFPDYGKGFLAACLEAYNQNPEEVIQRILDGTLHQDLLALDTSLQEMPQRKPSDAVVKDKGKGILVETSPQNIKPHKVDTEIHRFVKDAPSSSVSPAPQGPSSSVSSVPQGRFIRKGNDDLPDSAILDSKKAKDFVRSAVLESQYEYEDEYDDSFDDLGFSVVESSYEETDGANDDGPQWSSQKKPQFYVKDGKNYSYKVAGSVAVSSAREAAVMRQVQKDSIHGLGRGGNVPMGVPNRQHRDAEEEEGNAANNFSRGVSNPRGGGGRGRRGVMDHGSRPEEVENSNGPQGFGRGQRRDGRGHGNRPEESENFNSPQGFGRGERKGGRDQGNPPDYSENFNGTQGFGRGGRRGGRGQGNPPEERENSNSQQGFGRGGRRGGRGHGDAPGVNENFNDQRGFGRGAPRGARNHDYPAENNEDHDAAQGFARGGPAPRGGGGRRGGRNHHQKDRAMKKHMQGLTGL